MHSCTIEETKEAGKEIQRKSYSIRGRRRLTQGSWPFPGAHCGGGQPRQSLDRKVMHVSVSRTATGRKQDEGGYTNKRAMKQDGRLGWSKSNLGRRAEP